MPGKVRRILSDPETERLISVVSLTEIAIKTAVARVLIFPHVAVQQAIRDMRLTVLSYTASHAQALFELPFLEDHRNPFDRMLIATALREKLPVLSSDRHFRRYRGLTAIWR